MSYDSLYSASIDNILWSEKPGRLILKIKDYLSNGEILDAGCGDGKNSMYLEQQDFSVTGFDISSKVLNGLFNRFRNAGLTPKGIYTQIDLIKQTVSGNFDALISYGLFHCLSKKDRIKLHLKLQDCVVEGGFVFFTCLTNLLPMPLGHGTQPIDLVDIKEINNLFEGYEIIYKEEGEIVENHLPVIGTHKHSAVWIIAKK